MYVCLYVWEWVCVYVVHVYSGICAHIHKYKTRGRYHSLALSQTEARPAAGELQCSSCQQPHIIQVTGIHTAFPVGAGIWAQVGRLCSKRALNHWAITSALLCLFETRSHQAWCILAWPWICDHPASASENWDYKHMPQHPASSQHGGLWSKNVPRLSRDLHFSHSSVLGLNHAHIVWLCYNELSVFYS